MNCRGLVTIPGSRISPHDNKIDENFLLEGRDDAKRDVSKELGEIRLRIAFSVIFYFFLCFFMKLSFNIYFL